MSSRDARSNDIKCGNTILLLERTVLYMNNNISYVCNLAITSNLYRNSAISVTYTDYDISTADNIFTKGDFVISFFLLIIIFLILVYFIRSAINSVGVTRKYQGNNSPDGKEFYEI
jgi:hypothetical protein